MPEFQKRSRRLGFCLKDKKKCDGLRSIKVKQVRSLTYIGLGRDSIIHSSGLIDISQGFMVVSGSVEAEDLAFT